MRLGARRCVGGKLRARRLEETSGNFRKIRNFLARAVLKGHTRGTHGVLTQGAVESAVGDSDGDRRSLIRAAVRPVPA